MLHLLHKQREFFKWRAKHGGMEISDMVRLKELEKKPATEEDVRQFSDGQRGPAGGHGKKVVKHRNGSILTQWTVKDKTLSIWRACRLFEESKTCYRYQEKLSGVNALIADWLLRLTYTNCKWAWGCASYTCATCKACCSTTSKFTGSIGSWN